VLAKYQFRKSKGSKNFEGLILEEKKLIKYEFVVGDRIDVFQDKM
jgi:hypothetical protein